MCLSKITKEYKPRLKKKIVVYKVFNVNHEGNPAFPCMSLDSRYLVPMNKVLTAETKKESTPYNYRTGTGSKSYKTGFHCFVKREDVMKWKGWNATGSVVVQVEANEIMYRGLQIVTTAGRKPCISVVAHKMLLREADWKAALKRFRIKIPK
jgi:tRNA U38,U39,U40 pseudouridine synthase TruA